MNYKIILIKIGNRENTAIEVQKILTEFGCKIKTRLGLHNIEPDACSPLGLVILEVVADTKEINSLIKKLNAVKSVSAKYIKI
ncbi:MAG TPA: hypothetical protein PLM75_06235 [bacterium]|nr:hypothetical protein [bacterium]